ncbi:hypothetical protein [Bradyrhizobium sp. sBnM-33]|uniref:hypothetical protein n=1 Tax=Bradyrhizobium sp. sBnM-33 TaxID=2831780 RepID=UPI001BCF7385|nr:hypothetical protein [Bradyrhizobium sp. sBnM-33]WOH50791.1 hypothetical protein RX328_00275 [Bradyrhizobium sp. sBnM-33]
MFRSFTAVILLSCFAVDGWAQSPPTTNTPAASTPAKAVTKKAAPKAKAAAKQPVAAETGPCRLGIISALGDRFAVQKFGLTIFETEESAVAVEGWGFDDLVVARVRAATGTDPAVRRITYPKGAFEPFYNPTSRFLPDPREGLPAIVRSITPAANCERYLVVTRFKGQVPGTNLMLDGIGAYSRGLGSVIRHSHLFANVGVTLLDGGNYETISRPFAGLGTRLADGLRLTEDPLTKLDNSLFPEPATAVPGNAMLRERTGALVAARLDQTLPDYLKND